jgi:hypothetical protein
MHRLNKKGIKNNTDPYDEGYQASKENKPHYDSNPYVVGTKEWKRWSSGYFSYWFQE